MRGASPLAVATVLVLFGAALACRVWRLETLPGVNGDEAWYGAQVQDLLAGRAFAWRTPSGLPQNPFHAGVLALISLPVTPHIWVLRAPALLSSLLAVVVCAWLWRRSIAPLQAWTAALLFACLPALLAHARFGWDASHTFLVGALLLHFLMERRWLGVWLSFVASVWVHPTSVLLAPLVLAHLFTEVPPGGGRLDRRALMLRIGATVFTLAFLRAFLLTSSAQADPGAALGRLLSPSSWGAFLEGYGHLLSGITFYAYLVGPPSGLALAVHDVIVWGALLGALAFGLPRLLRAGPSPARTHVVGTALVLGAFFVLAGPEALAPPVERYAVVLVAPSVLAFVILLGHAFERRPRGVFVVGAALAALSLGGFTRCYLVALAETGGAAHRTFRTGASEPKAAALALLRARGVPPGCERVVVIAEDWWLYWPLRYLAEGDARFAIVNADATTIEAFWEDARGCGAVVGFAGGQYERRAAGRAERFVVEQVDDPLGLPILRVWTHAGFASPW